MRRAPALVSLPLATFLVVLTASCREARPWHDATWRPEQAPQRIVAASVFASEVLLAIAPRERLAAVHVVAADPQFSLVATAAAGLPLVGAEPEQLLAARPDLVICDPFTQPETLALLGAANVPVATTAAPGSFADIAANIRRVGALCHLETAAEGLVTTMQERLRALQPKASAVAGWRVLCLDGALHTHGRPSLFDALVDAAGASNLAAERGVGPFRKLDVEAVMAWRPDVIVVAEDEAPAGGDVVPMWLRQFEGVSLLPCVQQGRVVRVPAALLGTTSHHLAEAAHALQRQLLRWHRP